MMANKIKAILAVTASIFVFTENFAAAFTFHPHVNPSLRFRSTNVFSTVSWPAPALSNIKSFPAITIPTKKNNVTDNPVKISKRKIALKVLSRAVFSLCMIVAATSSLPQSALAADTAIAAETVLAAETAPAAAAGTLHIGQKVANYFRSFGLPDVVVLALLSALPVIELRGAVPVGLWMGLPITTVLPACVLGNMLPIIPLMFLLRNEKLKEIMSPILKRAEEKSSSLGVGSIEKQWASLAAFVGIPLPGTGAWTGAMGAFLLGMPTAIALSAIFTGVVAAGIIMSAITLAGKKGGIAALAILALVTGKEFLSENKQDFLEAEPYWDQSDVPVNTYKNKSPFTGKVVSTKRIVGPKATGETSHIIIDHNGEMPFWEGQSYGVIPPGVREKDGKPHSVRLYSIASTRYGDDMTGKTASLCVRRATYWCPELQAEDPAKKGICSNFLCDTEPGDEVKLTGPAGKVMLLPEEDPGTDYIMVATGTGIAPYRGFIRRLFVENTPAANAYEGQAWLFLGVANSDALLYDDEWLSVKENYPDNFRLDYALSREQTNQKGGKMYIQDKMEEYADEIFTKLDNGAHIYFCGLKGMMPGIQDMLKGVAKKKGIEYDEWLKSLKAKKQWHVEVY